MGMLWIHKPIFELAYVVPLASNEFLYYQSYVEKSLTS